MVITAEGGLYTAKENLRLALELPEETEQYHQYVRSLEEQVKYWQAEVDKQKERG